MKCLVPWAQTWGWCKALHSTKDAQRVSATPSEMTGFWVLFFTPLNQNLVNFSANAPIGRHFCAAVPTCKLRKKNLIWETFTKNMSRDYQNLKYLKTKHSRKCHTRRLPRDCAYKNYLDFYCFEMNSWNWIFFWDISCCSWLPWLILVSCPHAEF